MAYVVADLAEREAACGGFLDLTVEHMPAAVHLTVLSDEPAAAPVIAVLTGQPS